MSTLTPNQQQFFDFVVAREEAREAKFHGVVPHSDDPILQQFSFCNINREHDRVTMWLRMRMGMLKPYPSVNTLVFNYSVGRIINNPDALHEILPVKSCEVAKQTMLERQASGKSVFRGAYMMPSHGSKERQKISPIVYYFDSLKEIQAMDFSRCTHLAQVADMLLSVHGFGTFIVNQIVTDMRYTRHFAKAPDWSDFIWGGPGTSRGLCRYFDEPKLNANKPQKWIRERIFEVRDEAVNRLPEPILAYYGDPNNISNSFCEYDKYMRVLNDEGGRLRKYSHTKKPL